MPRILCTLPNASTLINGVKFASVPAGMLSEDVREDIAAEFALIPGYEIVAKAAGKATKAGGNPDDTGNPAG